MLFFYIIIDSQSWYSILLIIFPAFSLLLKKLSKAMKIKLKLSVLLFSIDFFIISLQIFSEIFCLFISFLAEFNKHVQINLMISLLDRLS